MTAIAVVNAVVCVAICARLLMFRREGARHRAWACWLAYALILASAWAGLEGAMGRATVGPGALVINLFLCVAVYRSRGNVCDVLRRPQPYR